MYIDTHCHIHEDGYDDAAGAYLRALQNGITKMICVGTDNASTEQAVAFASMHQGVYASVGVHPHESKDGYESVERILSEHSKAIVAVGEIGLDYFYTHSPREIQIQTFEAQMQLATDAHLPVIFHVREAFDDFWPVVANFSGIRGVLHSFTDTQVNMERALKHDLYIGINGISTFTKDDRQTQMFDAIPIEKILLETDSPFLTPAPHRGKVNEPAFVKHVAEYHANRRKVELEHLARVTSANASTLFSL